MGKKNKERVKEAIARHFIGDTDFDQLCDEINAIPDEEEGTVTTQDSQPTTPPPPSKPNNNP